ncbi:MAG: YgjP-like metallopeptidase domain-containing protein [Sphingopyxis sp.]|uniref:M48 family metallopeptidase n=1 Tax=Sphingopyxis sp. TaxID=1908224 RepID=UPI002AB80C24|nr:YgjP-like metallopeptidase domain-containing protein [Sphingopyxis sp.]MDZ3832136.1 YgjP-like metallopeptidase domain-containing protein [Sphingopyxis sp.]
MSSASSDRGAADPQIRVGDTSWPVRLVPHAQSRRYRLVFDAARGEFRLTLPRRASAARALKWAGDQREWIAEQVGKAALPIAVGPDSAVPLFGIERRIAWTPAAPRAVRLDGGWIHLGGPADTVARRIERWLKGEALALMERESREIAGRAGLAVGRVAVGDPRSRWGSCTATGDLRYSWRLVMAPDHVRRATVAHEVAHLRHMHHGPDFHALVDELHDGDVASARQWLRREGRGLHRYKFTA